MHGSPGNIFASHILGHGLTHAWGSIGQSPGHNQAGVGDGIKGEASGPGTGRNNIRSQSVRPHSKFAEDVIHIAKPGICLGSEPGQPVHATNKDEDMVGRGKKIYCGCHGATAPQAGILRYAILLCCRIWQELLAML